MLPGPGPAPPSIVEPEAEAIGCVIEVGLAGIAGAAPPAPAPVMVMVVDDGFSTAVTEDDAMEAGAAGIDVDVLLLFEMTAPARSHGFGGEGMMVVGSRFCGVPG